MDKGLTYVYFILMARLKRHGVEVMYEEIFHITNIIKKFHKPKPCITSIL